MQQSALDHDALAARLGALESTVHRLRLTAVGLVAVLLALVTCGSDRYSGSSTQEQLGLLMAREIRVGDEQAAVHILGHEILMLHRDGSRVAIDPSRIRFLAPDGSERAVFPVEVPAQPVAQ